MATMKRRRGQTDVADSEAPGVSAPEGKSRSSKQVVPITRAALTWAALAAGMALLVVVLVFILQNLTSVKASFFTVHWRIPLGLDLLFAAVLGGLIVFAAGSVRILQLRRLAHRHARAREDSETRTTDSSARVGEP